MWPLRLNQLRLSELTNFSKNVLVQASVQSAGLRKKRKASVRGNLEMGKRGSDKVLSREEREL